MKKERACPRCGSLSSHDHCVECGAKNAMPWTHSPTCSHYRPATEFDTPEARRAMSESGVMDEWNRINAEWERLRRIEMVARDFVESHDVVEPHPVHESGCTFCALRVALQSQEAGE